MTGDLAKYPYQFTDGGQVLVLFINPRLISPRAVFGVVSILANRYRFMVDGSPDGVVKLYVQAQDGAKLSDEDAWAIYTELLHQMAIELRATDAQSVIGRLVSPGPAEHSSSIPGGQ